MSTANAGVVRAFNAISRVYDNPLVQRLAYRANHDAVVSALRAHRARRIVDVGCGTGILASRIARELSPDVVYGCDPSEGMLEKARARSGEVRWIRGAAEALPLADDTVDAVVTTEAFQFFDQPAALAEFQRVLAPGGHLVISVITPLLPLPSFLSGRIPASWHTPAGMRELLEAAGLAVLDQRRLRLIGPDVATVAFKPA